MHALFTYSPTTDEASLVSIFDRRFAPSSFRGVKENFWGIHIISRKAGEAQRMQEEKRFPADFALACRPGRDSRRSKYKTSC